jgi:hypothetical protein
VERITVGVRITEQAEPLVVIRTRKSISAADVKAVRRVPRDVQPFRYEERTAGKHIIYEGKGSRAGQEWSEGPAFSVPESRVVLFGSADLLRKVLQRDGKPELPEAMRNTLDEANFRAHTLVVAVNAKAGLTQGENRLAEEFVAKNLSFVDPKSVKATEGVVYYAKAAADLEVGMVMLFKDAKLAQEEKAMADGNLVSVRRALKDVPQVPREVIDAVEAVTPTVSGSTIRLSATLKPAPLIKLIKAVVALSHQEG